MKIWVLFFMGLWAFLSTVTCGKRPLTEDEVVPAIISSLMGSSSRLELEKNRPNKTLSSIMTFGRADDSQKNEALIQALPGGTLELTDSGEVKPQPISRAKQDAIIRQLWGGSCALEDWIRCNNITTVGGDYFVKDNKGETKMEHFEMQCTTFLWVCMKNNWTVNRCHLLCMSACNRDLLETNKYDRYVLHEGQCEPVSLSHRG